MTMPRLPHDPNAEAAVLGSMIVDPRCIDAVMEVVREAAFYLPEHRTIWNVVLALHTNNGHSPIDGLIVRAELEKRGKLQIVGGIEYLQQILDTVPSSANADYYAQIVRGHYQRREIIRTSKQLETAAYDLTVNANEVLADAQETLGSIELPIKEEELPTYCVENIVPQIATWHLENMIPDFGITIIQGDGGVGKSRCSQCLAAKTSTGEPFGRVDLRPRKGSVRIYSAEDPKEFIAQNLRAEGADCHKVHIVPEICILPDAVSELGDWITNHADCRLVIFDSLPSYLGDVNTNSNTEVRSALMPLAALAAERRVAVVGINHLNKKADLTQMQRGLGSTAFNALARAVWGIILDQNDPELRLLGPVKSNYSIRPTGFKYRIVNGAVSFEPEPWMGKLDDAMRPRDGKLKIEECADWLLNRLSSGAVLSTTIFEEGAEQGFNKDLCYRAKDRLDLHAGKAGFEGKWYWELRGNGEESKNGI